VAQAVDGGELVGGEALLWHGPPTPLEHGRPGDTPGLTAPV
jgi:hypothetical protein